MESSPRAALLQGAIRPSISGNAQVINAGGNVVVHSPPVPPTPPPTGLAGLLRPVINATHTRAGHVARCDHGTRPEVIAQIEQWLDGSDKRAAICWIRGPAGYGKSAVAQTIAERYAKEGRLLGSFFFLRDLPCCSCCKAIT
ncbi:hypothetical protein K443DRAFT_307344 [Laccaria amethystina LaAM-08-1]|uniref:Unplaced genomic scaffold K443scaffold_20, whole genome shotgun sequence n=1 Tax=Laccaria amethystina LaAM-08-1 TaxID=1095629 RepID=A0A0C9XWS6_9AGAR|nr:hypothetical protein K443DRAFT_307344 [Laccaria amethystina LaAM-08-1]